jgi:hypothetical protein
MKTKIEMSFTEIGSKICKMLEEEQRITPDVVELKWRWDTNPDKATLTIIQEVY